MMKKVIITGATSGIGRALAVELHGRGYVVGATGRRVERLLDLEKELQERIYIQKMDVTHLEESRQQLQALISRMKGMDIIILNAGVSNYRQGTEWDTERQVIAVNIAGFTALANFSFAHFEKEGSGHLVGISSIASFFGYGLSAAYNASKSYVSNYLQGYRQKANHSNADIHVTDIKPGFVKSEMTESKRNLFWLADTHKAARQIADIIENKKEYGYITKRWRLVAWVLKIIPNKLFDRL